MQLSKPNSQQSFKVGGAQSVAAVNVGGLAGTTFPAHGQIQPRLRTAWSTHAFLNFFFSN